MIHTGDCVEVMAGMEPASVDAIVTDPPYGLEFMGKEWDKIGDHSQNAALQARMAMKSNGRERSAADPWATERSGYGAPRKFKRCTKCGRTEMNHKRDPKGCEPLWDDRTREYAVKMQEWHHAWATEAFRIAKPGAYLLAFGGTRTFHRMTCAIEDAGWIIRDCLVWAYASGFPKSRALLKPAWEPIVMARKPGPLRELAIDACRIGPAPRTTHARGNVTGDGSGMVTYNGSPGEGYETPGPAARWPANLILTDPIFDGDTPGVVGGGWQSGGGNPARRIAEAGNGGTMGDGWHGGETGLEPSDTEGSYSRFFLLPKADRAEREPISLGPSRSHTKRVNSHPTVKSLDLMRHLVRLVTPVGGTVLDPFLGSGTTGLAAEMEGFAWIGIEQDAGYVAIAEARLNGTQRGLGLPA